MTTANIKVVSVIKIYDIGETDKRIVKALAASIQSEGLLNPILLQPARNGRYRIIDGLYRVRAVKSIGHTTIEAMVRTDVPTEYKLLKSSVRKTTSQEYARHLRKALGKNVTVHELSKLIGRPVKWINEILRRTK